MSTGKRSSCNNLTVVGPLRQRWPFILSPSHHANIGGLRRGTRVRTQIDSILLRIPVSPLISYRAPQYAFGKKSKELPYKVFGMYYPPSYQNLRCL